MVTYAGNEVVGVLTGDFRPLTSEEIKQYDDGSEVKIGELPGCGDMVTGRISEYYVAGFTAGTTSGSALVHADAIIAAHSGKGRVRQGYRHGSLKIFFKSGPGWYDWNGGSEGGCGVPEADRLAIEHTTGALCLPDMILRARKDLTRMQRLPAQPERLPFFVASPEESDEDFSDRILRAAENLRALLNADKKVAFEEYRVI